MCNGSEIITIMYVAMMMFVINSSFIQHQDFKQQCPYKLKHG